jgi:hypothetical protein
MGRHAAGGHGIAQKALPTNVRKSIKKMDLPEQDFAVISLSEVFDRV